MSETPVNFPCPSRISFLPAVTPTPVASILTWAIWPLSQVTVPEPWATLTPTAHSLSEKVNLQDDAEAACAGTARRRVRARTAKISATRNLVVMVRSSVVGLEPPAAPNRRQL